MSGDTHAISNLDQPKLYHIRVKGHLDSEWSGWFEGLTITMEEGGNTLLSGPVVDGAALHGLLKKVHDLGLPLLLVKCVDCDQPVVAGDEQQSATTKALHQDTKYKETKMFNNKIPVHVMFSGIYIVLALVTLLPTGTASKDCLLEYNALCSFTPISTIIFLALGALHIYLQVKKTAAEKSM